MRAIIYSLLFLTFIPTAVTASAIPPLEGVTLKQCYELALARSETIAIQEQVIIEAEGRFYQSMGTFLPHVSFIDLEEYREKRPGFSSYAPERAFTFSQSLFSGFREFAGIARSKAEKKQRQYELERAKQLLFIDVVDAFYLFKSYQDQLAALTENNDALKDNWDELKRRGSLGRSRASEVANAESKLYQNEAAIASIQSQMNITRELLEFIVGVPVKSLSPENVVLGLIGPREDYVAKAEARADVKAAEQAYHVARKEVAIARGGYFPNVTLSGNRYIKRSGTDNGIDWDMTIRVDVPIFNGTITYGEVREANAVAEQVKQRMTQVKRQAVLDIQNAYTRVTEGLKQSDAYRKAALAAQKNYEMQEGDFQNSLVNTLDVLESLQELNAVRQNYIAVNTDAQRAYWSLKVATGDITNDTL